METSTHSSQQPKDTGRAEEVFTLVERVARIVSTVRGTKPDYARLAAELEQAIPFDVFGVVLLRHDRQAVRVSVSRRGEDEDAAWTITHHQLPLQASMLEGMLRVPTMKSINAPEGLNGLPADCGDALSGYPQLRSALIAPLLVEESEDGLETYPHDEDSAAAPRILGTLELGSVALHTYDDKTVQRLIQAVAHVLATAIERSQLGGSAEIQNRQRQVLKSVSTALASKVDISTILQQIVSGVEQALGVASAIMLLDLHKGTVRLEAYAGFDGSSFSQHFAQGIAVVDESIAGYTVRRRQPVFSADIAVDERFPLDYPLYQLYGVHSIYCYPLMTGVTVYGVLVLYSPEPGGFTPLKVDILSLFASQATIAVHNDMLLQSARQRSHLQEAIEQLERAHVQASVSDQPQILEQELAEEYQLLTHVREEAQRTFGVSFSTLLRFISEHLLTQNERNLQTVLQYNWETPAQTAITGPEDESNSSISPVTSAPSSMQATDTNPLPPPLTQGPFTDTLALLNRTAEAALMRSGMLGELGGLLMHLRESINSVRDVWFVVDREGLCVYMNPAAESLCKLRMEDVIGLTLEQIFALLFPRMRNADEVRLYLQDFTEGNTHSQRLRCVLAMEPIHLPSFDTELSDEQSQHATHQQPRYRVQPESAPSDYHYQLVRYPLHNQHEQLVGNALQMLDVTEQVRDEKNRSALLSSMSHDLRTPLTTIKAAVTGLLQPGVSWDTQELRAILEDIDTEADHLTVLVTAVIELSRIEMGALTLKKEWCDIAEVIYGAIAKAERVLAGHPVQVRLAPLLPLVYVDHVQMNRVVYNLLENAARHSPEHAEIVVNVDTVTQQLQGQRERQSVRVQVIDHGVGIPEHERERIFKSFYGLRSHGSGLGLAICKGIIDAHQGHLWVEGLDINGTLDENRLGIYKEKAGAGAVAEEDIVARITRKLIQQKSQAEGACFVFTLPTYSVSSVRDEESLTLEG